MRALEGWLAALPRVRPFFAVRANGDAGLLRTLAALGSGFACATENELDQVASLGAAPDRLMLAGACRRPRDVRAAARAGVRLASFESAAELQRLAVGLPGARALLRVGPASGAAEPGWPALLAAAAELRVEVVGVSLQLGATAAGNPEAWPAAVGTARRAFDLAAAAGRPMTVLDLGGGFPGRGFGPAGRRAPLASAINAELARHFPPVPGLEIVAQPGRALAEGAATLACTVLGRRASCGGDVNGAGAGAPGHIYWVGGALPLPGGAGASSLGAHPLRATPGAVEHLSAVLAGASCGGLPPAPRQCRLPELQEGDWLVFPRVGAYAPFGPPGAHPMDAADVPTYYAYSRQA